MRKTLLVAAAFCGLAASAYSQAVQEAATARHGAVPQPVSAPQISDGKPLSLSEAVRVALEKHPSMEAMAARTEAAEARIRQARSGWLPKVNYAESFHRSNDPVYVFGSLLRQNQFGPENFAVDRLNRPDFLNNFQSQIGVEQVVYDGGQTRTQVRSAELGRESADEQLRATRLHLVAAVARAYYGELLASEGVALANESLKSAEADLNRAEAIRTAGLSTDADVLSIRVHLAATRERLIRSNQELAVARAALNEAMGLPLDTAHVLTTRLAPPPPGDAALAEWERRAVEERPETRQAALAARLAETQAESARSALLPQVAVRGAFEADRQRFITRGGTNWYVGASLRWNLFNGFADQGRISEATQALRAARADSRRAESGIRLQVRGAHAEMTGSRERLEVATATVEEARESLRITKNRYEAGLTTVTDLLRNETASLEASTRRLAAIHDLRVAAVMLELAAGVLSADSEVLR